MPKREQNVNQQSLAIANKLSQEEKTPSITGSKGFAIGNSDFKSVVVGGYQFVDKSLLIKDIIADASQVKLIIRPRHFGKTLNLSMLKYFFSIKDGKKNRELFSNLKIQKEKEYQVHQGKYPVIHLSFKDIKPNTFDEAYNDFKETISEKYIEFDYLLSSKDCMKETEKEAFDKIMHKAAADTEIKSSLKNLSRFLCKHHNAKVVILIDEYDTPIITSYEHNYYTAMTAFMGKLLNPVLKDNSDLYMTIITGILRVAREHVIFGLGDFKPYSVLSNSCSQHFGFVKSEIEILLKNIFSINVSSSELERWYGGYRIGEEIIFNPWSIINFIHDNIPNNIEIKCRKHIGTNLESGIIKDLLNNADINTKKSCVKLVKKEPLCYSINDDSIILKKEMRLEEILSLLVFTGYLTLKNIDSEQASNSNNKSFAIPNQELFIFYDELVRSWPEEELKLQGSNKLVS